MEHINPLLLDTPSNGIYGGKMVRGRGDLRVYNGGNARKSM